MRDFFAHEHMTPLPTYRYGETRVANKPSDGSRVQTVFHGSVVRNEKEMDRKEMKRREKWFDGMWSMFIAFGSPMGKKLLAAYKKENPHASQFLEHSLLGDEYYLDECIDCELNFVAGSTGITIESWVDGVPAKKLAKEFMKFLNDPDNH